MCDDVRETVPVLDHGYLKYVEHWGSDERIIEAARMSTNKGFKGWGPQALPCVDCDGATCPRCNGKGTKTGPGDENLLRHLWTKKHATPFEMAGLVVEVQAPIMVFREWHRHRTQSYNEMSARYTPLPDVNYVPTVDRCMRVSSTNRQAQGVAELAGLEAISEWLTALRDVYRRAEDCYQLGLSLGVPKEIARLCVPVARYSKMRASANLRNWLAFLTLRQASDAQEEIRAYADVVGTIIARLFPRTWELYSAR